MSGESWSRAVFDRLYEADPDPWRFDSSPYEAAKYADTLDALGGRGFESGLELGCGNGAMTVQLARSCAALLAIDIAPAAIALASARCAGLDHVGLRAASLPEQFASAVQGTFDLVVVSELLYFLSGPDIDRLADSVLAVLRPAGRLVLVNWTGETDTPCTGDQAADRFIAAMLRQDRFDFGGHRRDRYRLDLLTRSDRRTVRGESGRASL
jgi:SAM-dependent methyltransferase